MIARSTITALCLVIGLLAFPALSQAEDVRFLSLIDGDSMLVEYQGRSQEVRLIGIDAPEWGQEYGAQARSHALRLCYGRSMRLEFDMEKRDRYGRLLAYVYCGNTMLNEDLVKAGLAIPLKIKPNTKYADRFRKAEATAKMQRRGFWLRGGLKETPAQWRKKHGKR